MPYFELWQCVKVLAREKWEDRERDGKCEPIPEEVWWREVEKGQMKAGGLRDNLWEGKSEVVICLDHRACCALLIPLLLSWSAHTQSLSETKLLVSPEKLPTLTHNMPQHDVLQHLTFAGAISTSDLRKQTFQYFMYQFKRMTKVKHYFCLGSLDVFDHFMITVHKQVKWLQT